MSPDLQRAIDRLAGSPLCWLATLFDRLARLLGHGRAVARPPRRILFIELAEIGGLVVAYPALAHAKRLFPQAELYFLTFAGGKGMLDLMGLVPPERQIIIRPDSLPQFLKDTWRAIRFMRAQGIEATVNLEAYARFSTLLAWLSGAKSRAGFFRFYEEGHYLGDLLTHRVVYNPHMHAALSYASLVEALAGPPGNEPQPKRPLGHIPLDLPRIATSPQARRSILAKLTQAAGMDVAGKKLVILNPNASDLVAARRWPAEHFVELGQGLLQDEDVVIVLTGTAAERAACAALAEKLKSPRVANLAGMTTLPELMDVYNAGRLMITNDSGPAHFASLTSLPILVLFGPETPKVFGPLGPGVQAVHLGLACSPCVSVYNQKRSACRDNQCLKLISPQEILARAQAILDGPPCG